MKIVLKKMVSSLMVLLFTMMLFGCAKETSSNVQTTEEDTNAKLVLTVVDKDTKKPVSGAEILIVGMDNTYKTNERGLSPEIVLKVNKDEYKKYGDELVKKMPSGSATVLVFKEGYKDYIVFNKSIYPGSALNTLKVEMAKLSKADKQKYIADVEQPHEVWIQELIEYCKGIKNIREISGENKITIGIKDQNSKAVPGAMVYIPELGIKGETDQSGKVTLSVDDVQEYSSYPAKKEFDEYTMVVLKDGYMPTVYFNAAVRDGEDNKLDIAIKPSKSSEGYTINYAPLDKKWVEELLATYKKQI